MIFGKKQVKKPVRIDGMYNRLTKVGTSRDRRTQTEVYKNRETQTTYELLYDSIPLAKKLVNIIPKEATREWIELTNFEEDDKQIFSDELKRLKVKEKFYKAARFSRLYGGGCIFIVDGTSLDKLVNPLENIKNINNLLVFNNYELQPSSELVIDINSPSFGLPMFYSIINTSRGAQGMQSFPIHHSRFIIIQGEDISKTSFEANNYFNYGILGALDQIIKDVESTIGVIPDIVSKFNLVTLKMAGMVEALTESIEEDGSCLSGQTIIQEKADQLNQDMTSLSIGIIDSEDDLSIINPNLSGLDSVIDRLLNKLVLDADVPHTILLGESPTGSNATGNSTTLDWYNKVGQWQESKLRDGLEALFEIIGSYLNITEAGFEFKPLWQPTEKEIAETRQLTANTDAVYISSGVLSSEEVRQSRFGGENYSIDTTIDDDEFLNGFEETTEEYEEEEV